MLDREYSLPAWIGYAGLITFLHHQKAGQVGYDAVETEKKKRQGMTQDERIMGSRSE